MRQKYSLTTAAVILLAGAAIFFWSWRPRTPPKTLLARALAALGGRAALEAEVQRPATLVGTMQYFRGAVATMQMVEYRDRDRLSEQRAGAGLHQIIYIDRRGGWLAAEGVVENLPRHEWLSWRVTQEEVRTLLHAGQPGYRIESLGWRRLPDSLRAEAVRISTPLGLPIDYYFDPATHRIAAIGYGIFDPRLDRVVSTLHRWWNYGRIGRIWWPARIDSYRDGQLEASITVQHMEFGSPVPPGVFVRPAVATISRPVTVPIELFRGIPFVYVSVNGGQSMRFMLDTSTAATALSPEAESRAGIRVEGKVNTEHFFRPAGARTTYVARLSVGTASEDHLTVWVDDRLKKKSGPGFEGRLGYNFLGHFQVTIDYAAKKLILAPRGAALPPGESVPLYQDNGFSWVSARVAGHPTWLQVDTGITDDFVLPTLGRQLARFRIVSSAPISGAGGHRVQEYAVTIPSIQVGSSVLYDQPVWFIDPDAVTRGYISPPNGLLGARFLRRFRVTFAYAQGRLVLAPELSAATR